MSRATGAAAAASGWVAAAAGRARRSYSAGSVDQAAMTWGSGT